MKKILIIDDDERIRDIYSKLLTSEGYNVVEATDGQDGFDLLTKENIDLALLDIEMPKIDGDALYKIIQTHHRNVKVIVSSVYPLDEQMRIIPGAIDYYDKSHGIDLLLSKIKEALKTQDRDSN